VRRFRHHGGKEESSQEKDIKTPQPEDRDGKTAGARS
jgi:hypothetical protein